MGICCSKAAAGGLDEEGGFPWMHDDLFHHHLWTSAAVSLHTKQGWKGTNQDAMTVCQDFAGHKGHIFCGVFDGHGPQGREIARHVRDTLPMKLSSALKPKTEQDRSTENLKLRTEGDHLSNTLKVKTEEDHLSNTLKLRTEEDHLSNTLELRSEQDHLSNTLELRTEEEHVHNTLKLRTEEDHLSNTLKLRAEEDHSLNTLKLRTEEDHPHNNLKLIRTEEDHPSNNSKCRTEENPSSSSTDLDSFDKSDSSSVSDTSDESQLLSTWKNIFTKTFEEVDGELRQHSGIDCICSGTTAVTVVRQGDHLFIANLG